MGFEEDEEGNLCLIAYPLHSDSGVGHLENIDLSVNSEPYSKMLHWGNKQLSARSLLDSHEDKDKRWDETDWNAVTETYCDTDEETCRAPELVIVMVNTRNH